MSFEILEGGIVAAHTPSNVRIIDSARNCARGQQQTAKQADILEAAIVINNAVRPALGDALRDTPQHGRQLFSSYYQDRVNASIRRLPMLCWKSSSRNWPLADCAPDPGFAMSPGADNFDWARRHQEDIIQAQEHREATG
jgi:hypothetical protein